MPAKTNSKILSFTEFTSEVKQWTIHNFNNKQNPYLGMVEELGELSHCILKRMQGIRGYERPAFFHEHYFDAIGDIGVYSANFAFLYSLEQCIEWPHPHPQWKLSSFNEHIAYACRWLSFLGSSTAGGAIDQMQVAIWLGNFLLEINALATLEKGTLQSATLSTWASVKQRDWTKNKTSGNLEEADVTTPTDWRFERKP